MNSILQWGSLERGVRRTKLIHWCLIIGAGWVSLWLAYQLRFEFSLPTDTINWPARMIETMQWILPLEYILFYAFGLFKPLVARFRPRDFIRVVGAVGVLTLFLYYLWFIFAGDKMPSRSVILINGLLLTLTLCFIMTLSSQLRFILTGNLNELPVRAARVLAVGTGFLSYQLIEKSRTQRGLGMRVVGLATTNDSTPPDEHWQGVPVGGDVTQIESICRRFDPDRIIITDPELGAETLQQLVWKCRQMHVPVHIVPSAQEMFDGVLRIESIRPIGLDDILGRNALEIDLPRIHGLLCGKRVMVTGAGGSIGSELCRQILALGPAELVLVDYSEASLFGIQQDLKERTYGDRVHAMLIDVRDGSGMSAALRERRPQILFHSAALKHVPMVEAFPAEGLRTNALATQQLADLAEEHEVERMVFISTDKAINPSSVMGASKRLAEQLLQARPRGNGHTAFVAVRFGNVIGSSGSVAPIFEQQIARGGPVTVTHPDVTRYFMSIPEAVGLVLQSASQGDGGEIFMLDMGEPIKVIDVARLMIQLRGLEPDVDIEIKIVGLRPGEKLFEELRYDAEIHGETSHPRVYQLTASALSPDEARQLLASIQQAAGLQDGDAVRAMVKKLLPEFIGAEVS